MVEKLHRFCHLIIANAAVVVQTCDNTVGEKV